MPVFLESCVEIRPFLPGTTAWHFTMCGNYYYIRNLEVYGPQIPLDASALIIRYNAPSPGFWTDVSVAEYYPGDDYTNLQNKFSDVAVRVEDETTVDIIVAYRGPGSLVARIDAENCQYVGGMKVIGYFTPEEFTAFEDRRETTVDLDGTVTDWDITGESWYVPEATAYLRGGTDSIQIAPSGWVSRGYGSAIEVSPSVFWPNANNQVDIYSNNNMWIHIPGYFTGNIIKGTYPGGVKPVAAELKPMDALDELTRQEHTVDPYKAMTIAYFEYRTTLRFTRPNIKTINASTSGSTCLGHFSVGSGGLMLGGREGKEIFICGASQEADRGKTDLYILDNIVYDYDGFVEYCSFPVTGRPDRAQETLEFDDWTLNDPDLLQVVTAGMSVPVVYRTQSGSYTWDGTLALRLSGGESNADPADSLGGVISVNNAADNLFSDVTNRMAQVGQTTYRCIYVKNTSGTQTAYGLILWIEQQAHIANTISVGLAPEGINGVAQIIGSDEIPPNSVEFSQPTQESTGLFMGVLTPGDQIAVWVRRDVDIGASLQGADNFSLAFSIANNG